MHHALPMVMIFRLCSLFFMLLDCPGLQQLLSRWRPSNSPQGYFLTANTVYACLVFHVLLAQNVSRETSSPARTQKCFTWNT